MSTAPPVVVRYRTRPETADENAALVEAVYAGLRRDEPGGFHYATFRLDDGVTFIHVAVLDDADTPNPLDDLPEFAAFTAGVSDRSEEGPVVHRATLVGQYHAFDEDTQA